MHLGNDRLALSTTTTTHLSSSDICHPSSDNDTASATHACTHRQLHVQYRLATADTARLSPFRLAPTSPRSWHRTTPGASRVAPPPRHQTTTASTATHHNHVHSHGRKGMPVRFPSLTCFSRRGGRWQWQRLRQGTGKGHWGTWQHRACAHPAIRHRASDTTRACWHTTTISRAAHEWLMVTI